MNLEMYLIPTMESGNDHSDKSDTISEIYHQFNKMMKDANIRPGNRTYKIYHNLSANEDTPAFIRIEYPYYDSSYSGSGSDYDNGLSKSNKNEKTVNILSKWIKGVRGKYNHLSILDNGYRGHGYMDIIENAKNYPDFSPYNEVQNRYANTSKKKDTSSKKDEKEIKANKRNEDRTILKQIISDCNRILKSNKISNSGNNRYNMGIMYDHKRECEYLVIGHTEYSSEALKVLVNEWNLDVANGEIVNVMKKIVSELRPKYPMANFKRVNYSKNDQTRYFISIK